MKQMLSIKVFTNLEIQIADCSSENMFQKINESSVCIRLYIIYNCTFLINNNLLIDLLGSCI